MATAILVFALGLAVTGLLVKVRYRSGFQAADLGYMSHQWLAAYNASQPSSSQ